MQRIMDEKDALIEALHEANRIALLGSKGGAGATSQNMVLSSEGGRKALDQLALVIKQGYTSQSLQKQPHLILRGRPVDPDIRAHVFGILVVQDVVAIVLMAVVTALSTGQSMGARSLGLSGCDIRDLRSTIPDAPDRFRGHYSGHVV